MMIKVVAILVLILASVSFGLYKSVQANGELKQREVQMEQALSEANNEIIAMVETEKVNQRIAAKNIQTRNTIINTLRKQVAQLSEIENGDPNVKEFLDIPIPDSVVDWLPKPAGEDKDSEAVPADAVHGADSDTVPAGQNG